MGQCQQKEQKRKWFVCVFGIVEMRRESPFPNPAQGGFGVFWQVDYDEGKEDWVRKG